MRSLPTLAFGDDGSPAADVCWMWINSHSWPGWRLEIITARGASIGPPPTPDDATLHSWDPPARRTPFAEAAFAGVEHLTAQLDPRLALWRRADLLVIGPRGPGLLKALHLGSTAEWLLQHPIAPLVIARAGHPVGSVIACHDGSRHAQRAVESLAKLPWIRRTEVTILVVNDGRAELEAVNPEHSPASPGAWFLVPTGCRREAGRLPRGDAPIVGRRRWRPRRCLARKGSGRRLEPGMLAKV